MSGEAAVETLVCPDCEGSGYGTPDLFAECCGNVLPTGECCAAQYGTARLVEVPAPPCERCAGAGEIELP